MSGAACPSVDSLSRFLRFFKVGDRRTGTGCASPSCAKTRIMGYAALR